MLPKLKISRGKNDIIVYCLKPDLHSLLQRVKIDRCFVRLHSIWFFGEVVLLCFKRQPSLPYTLFVRWQALLLLPADSSSLSQKKIRNSPAMSWKNGRSSPPSFWVILWHLDSCFSVSSIVLLLLFNVILLFFDFPFPFVWNLWFSLRDFSYLWALQNL